MKTKANPSAVYDIVKAITLLLVVLAHSTRMYTAQAAFTPLNQSPLLAWVTDCIYAFHMPLFMFVTGSVYGLCIQQGKYEKPFPFIANKAKRLLIPYFIFGFFYVAPVMCLTGVTGQSYLSYCLNGIIRAWDPRHLWFLLSLFLIFLLAALFRPWLLHSHRSRGWVLLLSALLAAQADSFPGILQLRSAAINQFYFFLGTGFHFLYPKAEALLITCKFLPVILLASFFFGSGPVVICIRRFAGILMILSLAVFWERKTHIRTAKFFRCIQNAAMGIYLFHPMLIYLGYWRLGRRDIPPVLLAAGIAAAAFCLSLILTKLVRRLGWGMILGEA